jgi:hypothetical protein
MSLSDVRSYFKDQVKDEVPTAVEHTDAFNIENMHVNARDKMYHIIYQNSSNIETHGDRVTDNISVTISMIFKGYRNTQSAFDSTSDTAHNIKLRASKISNYTNGIKRVVCDSINITPVDDSNDNILLATMEFSVRMDFNTI